MPRSHSSSSKSPSRTTSNQRTEGINPSNQRTEGINSSNQRTEGINPSNQRTEGINPSNPPPKYHSPIGPIMSSSQIPSYRRSEATASYTPSTQNQSPGFFQNVKDGIALGAGSAIGHRIVNSIFGSPAPQSNSQISQSGSNAGIPTVYGSTSGNPCEVLQTSFNTCIQERKPTETCEQTLTLLNKCLSGSSS